MSLNVLILVIVCSGKVVLPRLYGDKEGVGKKAHQARPMALKNKRLRMFSALSG